MMGRIGHESERLMGYLLGYFRLWPRNIFYLVWGKIADLLGVAVDYSATWTYDFAFEGHLLVRTSSA